MGIAPVMEFEANEAEPKEFSIEQFLAIEQSKDLLRFTTAGSVDDGKSTLIGRLLYDSKNVYEDHVRSVTRTQGAAAASIDFAQLTDGLRAEREQGITIDVAYRYFSTARRKFIIADTPGHEQYTRNMATGASTASLAIILVDARKGILNQSRRHAYIASLLGIPRVIAAINKMDLVSYSQEVFDRISKSFADLAARVGLLNVEVIPISALEGDNVVHASTNMPWYAGPTLLEYLETVPVARESALAFRLPVQRVIRPHQNFRGFAGQIAAGTVRRGDYVVALPSGHTSRIQSIVTFDGELESASAPLSITVTLEDERDISRGDVIAAAAAAPPQASNHFEASMVWLHEQPLQAGRRYLLKHTSQTIPARVRSIRHRIDIETLDPHAAVILDLNGIGVVEVETDRPLLADLYTESRATGSFILIDPASNATVGAGMIRHILTSTVTNTGQPPSCILLANSALATQVEQRLLDLGTPVVRTRVRDRNVWIALLRAGVTVLVENDQDPTSIITAKFESEELSAEEVTNNSLDAIVQKLRHGRNPSQEEQA